MRSSATGTRSSEKKRQTSRTDRRARGRAGALVGAGRRAVRAAGAGAGRAAAAPGGAGRGAGGTGPAGRATGARPDPGRTSAASCSGWWPRHASWASTRRWNCGPPPAATATSCTPGSARVRPGTAKPALRPRRTLRASRPDRYSCGHNFVIHCPCDGFGCARRRSAGLAASHQRGTSAGTARGDHRRDRTRAAHRADSPSRESSARPGPRTAGRIRARDPGQAAGLPAPYAAR